MTGDVRAALHRAIDAALDRAELELSRERTPLFICAARATPPETAWQRYAAELLELCARVRREADAETFRGFADLLIEVAAKHALLASRDDERPW